MLFHLDLVDFVFQRSSQFVVIRWLIQQSTSNRKHTIITRIHDVDFVDQSLANKLGRATDHGKPATFAVLASNPAAHHAFDFGGKCFGQFVSAESFAACTKLTALDQRGDSDFFRSSAVSLPLRKLITSVSSSIVSQV